MGLSGVTAISAGPSALYSLALKSDGTVVAWGYDIWNAPYGGRPVVPAGLNGVTAIAAGAHHTLALKNDGTVIGWGSDDNGQIDIPTDCHT